MRLFLPKGEVAALCSNGGSNNMLRDHGHTPHVIVFYYDGRYIGDGFSTDYPGRLYYLRIMLGTPRVEDRYSGGLEVSCVPGH